MCAKSMRRFKLHKCKLAHIGEPSNGKDEKRRLPVSLFFSDPFVILCITLFLGKSPLLRRDV
jgi:hypothetical protein